MTTCTGTIVGQKKGSNEPEPMSIEGDHTNSATGHASKTTKAKPKVKSKPKAKGK